MKKCNHNHQIDNYLLNRMDKVDREIFEAHYFNCSDCFDQLGERESLIEVIKNEGPHIFQDVKIPERTEKRSLLESISSRFPQKQWIMAGAMAALLIVIFIGINPLSKNQPGQFYINDDLVRGESITLISPVINVDEVPTKFSWKTSGKDTEYRVYIYDSHPIWNTTTKDTSVILPPAVRAKIVAGEKYSWQVKAFSPEGSLIAVSSKVQFKVSK